MAPTSRPATACGLSEATCANGECIAREGICDGRFDCYDRSDEVAAPGLDWIVMWCAGLLPARQSL